MNFLTGTQTSNAATVPAGSGSDIDIYTTYTTHFTIDINGYYTIYQAYGDGFASVSSSGIGVIGVSDVAYGVEGVSSISFGVVGLTSGSGSSAAGVTGISSDAIGISGTSQNYNGVWATSTNHDAIFASGGRDGAYVEGVRNGLVGASSGTSGILFGVVGTAASPTAGSAGVLGRVGSAMTWADSSIPSGIRGDGKTSVGVIGFSEYIGIAGVRSNVDGSSRVEGHLATGTYGVYSFGDTGATGVKSFVEPHPTDPEKIVKYVSLEGPEAGTYFRGRGVVTGGRATIEVPESFRIVTDSEGLTVHITPMGRPALVGVVSADLNNIVVEATRDVEFSYIVYGVRKAFKDFQPIQMQEGEFMPMSPASRLPTGVPEESRRRLIDTGVYNEDGTVNMETANRLGWVQLWRDRGFVVEE